MNAITKLPLSKSDTRAKVLSSAGGPVELEPELRKIMCLLDDGRLLVSQTHLNDPYVISYEAKARRMLGNRTITKVPSDMETILSVYQTHQGNTVSERVDTTKMQQKVVELLEKGVKDHASDIHIRVEESVTKIWFRIHNDLIFKEEHVSEYGEKLCSTIYTSMADVSDTAFKPKESQDARIADRAKLPSELFGVRIATTPTVNGHNMVLRLLYNDAGGDNALETLGYTKHQTAMFKLMKARPMGMNIICGPTGSGKSTTLQRTLSGHLEERQYRINLITVEDPAEYPIPGAVQTSVTNADNAEERSKKFERQISAAMRLDPDVIMVGEIRDSATASTTLRAAMTGHQVWSTVHANDAMAIIDRLVDLGLPIAMLADHTVLTGLVCQTLVKVLCPECKVAFLDHAQELDSHLVDRVSRVADAERVYLQGEGCEHCHGHGVMGRTVVAEIIIPDPKFLALIRDGKKLEARDYWMREQHGKTMLQHCIEKINSGLVDPRMAEEKVGPLTFEMALDDNRLDASEVKDVV